MKEKRLLVVDDNDTILDLACAILDGEEYKTSRAGDGMEALEKLQKDKFDILLTDIKMPRMDGLSLIREARNIHPGLVSIVMTGCGSVEDVASAVREGAHEFLVKPFDISALRLAISTAWERKDAAEENVRQKALDGVFEVSVAMEDYEGGSEMLHVMLKSALAQTGAKEGSFMLLDEKTNELRIAAAIGLPERIVRGARVQVDQGIAALVAQSGHPTLVTDVQNHPIFGLLSPEWGRKSFISIPIISASASDTYSTPSDPDSTEEVSKKLLGVLNVSQKADDSAFTESELKLLMIFSSQCAVTLEKSRLVASLRKSYGNTLESMALMLEARDVYTSGHSRRVTEMCTSIGKKMQLSSKELQTLSHAANLHDIGKVGINESILNKPGRFTDEEYKIMKQHPVIGEKIVSPVEFLQDSRHIIRHHHERCDGKGYPDGLTIDQMDILTHIIIVADAYDAMCSNRSYRDALDHPRIIKELVKNKGTQFHSKVVDCLLEVIGEAQSECEPDSDLAS